MYTPVHQWYESNRFSILDDAPRYSHLKHPVVCDEDIGGLEVAVGDAHAPQISQRRHALMQKGGQLRQAQVVVVCPHMMQRGTQVNGQVRFDARM